MKVKSLTSILMKHTGVKDLKINNSKPQHHKLQNCYEEVYRGTDLEITGHLVVETKVRETKSWSLTKMNDYENP